MNDTDGDTNEPTILVVEDEPDVAETYRIWLDDAFEVLWAEDGDAALDLVDDGVDVVLLDRMMPGMSGDEVIETIRERGVECRVAMVTAVDPDFDIIEMGFDEYVTKPPTREGLIETVQTLLERADYADRVQRYGSLLASRAALQAEKSADELEANDEFAELERQIGEIEAELTDEKADLADDTTFVTAVRDLTEDDGEGEDGGP